MTTFLAWTMRLLMLLAGQSHTPRRDAPNVIDVEPKAPLRTEGVF